MNSAIGVQRDLGRERVVSEVTNGSSSHKKSAETERALPIIINTLDLPPPPLVTSAVTRSWSDVDPVKMLMTFAATSFAYSVLGQPLFLAIARQQYAREPLGAVQVLSEVFRLHGVRGLFRGAGAAITGTVISELVYYLTVEYCKEKLPLKEREWRSFGSGLMADFCSAPVFTPFAVVSQVQMVAGCSLSSEHNYMSARRTMVTLLREQGIASLFRGTMLTMMVAPLSGAWWYVYECFKRRAYSLAPVVGPWLARLLPTALMHRLPASCKSYTDNVLVNCGVGAAASMTMGVAMNPVYVLRLRLQVQKLHTRSRFPAFYILQDILKHEGARAFWKGLNGNLLVAVAGGCAFGVTYEGTKKFSDITQKTAAGPPAKATVQQQA